MPLLTRPRTSASSALTASLSTALERARAAATPARMAVTRTGVGGVLLVRPRLMPTALGVDSASAARTAWVVQMLGAREVALGLGTLVALRSPDGRAARAWVAAGALSDGADVLTIGAAVLRGRLSRRTGGLVVLSALAGTLAGLRALDQGPLAR